MNEIDEIKKILIIDDNPNPTADMLNMYGFEVTVTGDGKQGLIELNKNIDKYDLVLLDVMMPVMDGWTTLKNIRNHKLYSHNTSGVSGVHFAEASNKWKATIRYNGRNIHLGYYASFEDAVNARIVAEKELGYTTEKICNQVIIKLCK